MFKKYFPVTIMLLFCVFAAKVMAAPQPIVYFTFDELNASVPDASGNGNDGTIKGAVELSNDGKEGGAFVFNGVDAYVEIERVVQDNFTLMAWIKTDTPGLAGTQAYHGNGLIWSDVSGVADDFLIAVLGTKASFFIGDADPSINTEADIVTGEWVHVAGVRNATDGEIAIYIDGKLDISAPGYDTPLVANPIIAIGSNVLDGRFYTGLIDEVKIFDVALTEQEVQQCLKSSFFLL